MSATRASRLPGFKFETLAPPLAEVLPRMDIAVFVGFAASGPLEIPVAIRIRRAIPWGFWPWMLRWPGTVNVASSSLLASRLRCASFFANGASAAG